MIWFSTTVYSSRKKTINIYNQKHAETLNHLGPALASQRSASSLSARFTFEKDQNRVPFRPIKWNVIRPGSDGVPLFDTICFHILRLFSILFLSFPHLALTWPFVRAGELSSVDGWRVPSIYVCEEGWMRRRALSGWLGEGTADANKLIFRCCWRNIKKISAIVLSLGEEFPRLIGCNYSLWYNYT